MGLIKANGIEFYYEIHGEGEPLVLIEGLGYDSWMWYKQVNELSKHFKVIIFDNRGVGKTEKPDMEYSIEMFADDTAEILCALEIEKTHVLGVSMGGFIAQEFALKYPEMIDKLILCSTTFGGPNCIPPTPEALNIMMKGGGEYKSSDEIKEAISIALDKDSIHEHEDIVIKIMKEKMKNPQPKYAYQRQVMAGAGFNSEEKISKIKAETLILGGVGDRIIPCENAKLLNENIAHSKINMIENGGHVFFMEEPEVTNELIIEFLKK